MYLYISTYYEVEMKLITEEIKRILPKLYEQESLGYNATVYVKFFTPDSNWTWYATEFDGKDLFFGLVCGFEGELGYFSLSELQNVTSPLGFKIERDLYFKQTKLKNLMR
jgi:hypothetical protein